MPTPITGFIGGSAEPDGSQSTRVMDQLCDLLRRIIQAFGLAAGRSVSMRSVNSDQALNQALASGNLIVHDQRNGFLLFNQNGSHPGFGSGGVLAILPVGSDLQAVTLR